MRTSPQRRRARYFIALCDAALAQQEETLIAAGLTAFATHFSPEHDRVGWGVEKRAHTWGSEVREWRFTPEERRAVLGGQPLTSVLSRPPDAHHPGFTTQEQEEARHQRRVGGIAERFYAGTLSTSSLETSDVLDAPQSVSSNPGTSTSGPTELQSHLQSSTKGGENGEYLDK